MSGRVHSGSSHQGHGQPWTPVVPPYDSPPTGEMGTAPRFTSNGQLYGGVHKQPGPADYIVTQKSISGELARSKTPRGR